MDINKQISRFFDAFVPDIMDQERIAVAVSGGGDSMALSYALSQAFPDKEIHFLTVDHGLRVEASGEALNVQKWVSEWGKHKTLVWKHDGVETKVQEDARQARYNLMISYCKNHDIEVLFLGHHQDDLIETFLMRLSSGSGLDGLSSIAPVSWMKDVAILRPFYDCSHADLIEYCKSNKVSWIEDPSNDQDQYKRVRFRKAQEFLSEEGLTSKRLSKTIERMARARDALDQMTVFMLDQIVVDYSDEECGLDLPAFYDLHAEFQIRAILLVIERLAGVTDYPPRLEKLEGLVHDLGRSAPFRKRTFAGCVFEVKPKDNVFIISLEKR